MKVVTQKPAGTGGATQPQPQPSATSAGATTAPTGNSGQSNFANRGGQAPVAGVTGNVPDAPPAPAVPTPWKGTRSTGNIFDAREYLTEKLKISGKGALHVFHHTDTLWGTPGVKRKMTISQNKGQTGQLYGAGFYTSTKPETIWGKYEFQVELPFRSFEGKQIYESKSSGDEMPPGVDILAIPQYSGEVWFIFKPDSERWLNRSASEADFDREGESVGWS